MDDSIFCIHCSRYKVQASMPGCPEHFQNVEPIAKLESEKNKPLRLMIDYDEEARQRAIGNRVVVFSGNSDQYKKAMQDPYKSMKGEPINKDSFLTKSWFLNISPPENLDREAIEIDVDDTERQERRATVLAHLSAWRKIEKKSPRRVMSKSMAYRKLKSTYHAYYRATEKKLGDEPELSNLSLALIIHSRNFLHSLKCSEAEEGNTTLNEAVNYLLDIVDTQYEKQVIGHEKVLECHVKIGTDSISAEAEIDTIVTNQWDDYRYDEVQSRHLMIEKAQDGQYAAYGYLRPCFHRWPMDSRQELEVKLEDIDQEIAELDRYIKFQKTLTDNPKYLHDSVNHKFSELSQSEQFEIIAHICDKLPVDIDFPKMSGTWDVDEMYRCIWIFCYACNKANATITTDGAFRFEADGLSFHIYGKKTGKDNKLRFKTKWMEEISFPVNNLLRGIDR